MRWSTIGTDSSVIYSSGRKKRGTTDKEIREGSLNARVIPSGRNPQVDASPAGIVISWEDAKGRRESRRLPAGTRVIWEDGAFRIAIGERAEPAAKSAGAWA